MKMILITVYFEGDITQNVHIGIKYTIGPRLKLSGTENVTLTKLRVIHSVRQPEDH
jgi:hypothetical protein